MEAATARELANNINAASEQAASSPPAVPQASEPSYEPAGGETALAPLMLSGDFPLYLTVVARQSSGKAPGGCKDVRALLAEMAEEPRDTLWADHMERELREFIGPHPHGFHVSVGCRASICQVSVVGEHDALTEDSGAAAAKFWHNFRQGVQHSAMADEVGFNWFFGGIYPTHPPQHIEGTVLTSIGREEPPGCRTFGSRQDSDEP
jgi:hypothetical protein